MKLFWKSFPANLYRTCVGLSGVAVGVVLQAVSDMMVERDMDLFLYANLK